MPERMREFLSQPVHTVMTRDPACVHPTQHLSVVRHAMMAAHGHHVADNPLFSTLELVDGPDAARAVAVGWFGEALPLRLDRQIGRAHV